MKQFGAETLYSIEAFLEMAKNRELLGLRLESKNTSWLKYISYKNILNRIRSNRIKKGEY